MKFIHYEARKSFAIFLTSYGYSDHALATPDCLLNYNTTEMNLFFSSVFQHHFNAPVGKGLHFTGFKYDVSLLVSIQGNGKSCHVLCLLMKNALILLSSERNGTHTGQKGNDKSFVRKTLWKGRHRSR
jgi:hypothetical protein